jgi:hypothetical protein
MTLGEFGSTLNDELNRLANGGTYRDKVDMVDEALAAKQWANRENISPYSTDTVGVLNEIAGRGLDKKNWLDFNGICNAIAGTTGLPAAAALRQVYPTTDLLTGVAAYYVDATDASASTQTVTNLGTAGSLLPTTVGSSTSADSNDPKFLDHTGTNYLYLPGVSNNTLTVPDSAALDITGDIDIRVRVALDDWTPGNIHCLIAKATAVGGGISYLVNLNTTGTISFAASSDGTALVGGESTVATGITDGTTKWVRATFDVDNDASGNEVKFFLSDDGATWNQLGSTITNAGTTSIFASTTAVSIGARANNSTNISTMKVFRAQILDGIDGTTVLDVDTSVITAGSATSFTAVTGQTVTINRSTSGRKTVAVTQPTWLFGTDDFMFLDARYMYSGTYLYLPGITGNWASTPDAAVLDITGDIDIRCKVALDDWTPITVQRSLVSKRASAPNISYSFDVATTGELLLNWSTDGTAVNVATSSVTTGIADGAVKWVRVTLDVDNGASGNDVKFYLSDDGTNWTQLGTTITTAGTTSIFNSNSAVGVGARAQGGGANSVLGKFFRAQVLDGIDGTVAFDADFETSITSLLQADFTESSLNAATVTINRSGSAFRSAGITEAGYLYPGATNTFSASDTDFFSFPDGSDFTFLAIVRQWNTAVTNGPYINKISQTNATAKGWTLSNNDVRIGTNNRLIYGYTPATAGSLSNIVVTKDSTPNLNIYVNNTLTSTAYTQTGDISTTFAFFLGRASFTTAYQDFEFVGAAVFRSALTAAQVRQVTNYFANREVYL